MKWLMAIPVWSTPRDSLNRFNLVFSRCPYEESPFRVPLFLRTFIRPWALRRLSRLRQPWLRLFCSGAGVVSESACLPPAGYFLCAQKVPKDAQEPNGFLISFPVDKRGICRMRPMCPAAMFAKFPLSYCRGRRPRRPLQEDTAPLHFAPSAAAAQNGGRYYI